MLIAVAVITVVSAAALIAAFVMPSEVTGSVCIGLCVVGLILLIVDKRRTRRRGGKTSSPVGRSEHDHRAGDQLLAEDDLARDLAADGGALEAYASRSELPHEQAVEDFR